MKSSRRTSSDPAAVPPVLPVVRMVVQDDGTMLVTIDGQAYPPPEFAPAWRRESFPAIIDHLTKQRTVGARIEIVEVNGHVFTDYITPTRKASPEPQPEAQPEVRQEAVRPPAPVQFAGSGFVPGEGVAVAIVVAYTSAGHDGIARALFDPRQFAGTPTGEAVLLGSISGTLTFGKPA